MAQAIPSVQKLVVFLIITLILTIGALYVFHQFFEPAPISFSKIVEQAVNIIIIFGFSLAAIAIIRRFKPLIAQRVGNQAATMIQYAMLSIAVLVMLFGILNSLNVPASDLLAGAGIISITAGLVISTFVGSLLSGFLVFTNYRFKVGDDVVVNNIPGRVVAMTALVMRIQTDVGQITIPNSAVSSGGVIITVVHEYELLKEGRLHYQVGDRVMTSFMNEQGIIKEIRPLNTTIQLDSGKEITLLNNSILSGAVVVAKITQTPTETKKQPAQS